MTHLELNQRRGSQAYEVIGILPKRTNYVVHDDYSSYFCYADAQHVTCNAHHLRVDLSGRALPEAGPNWCNCFLRSRKVVATAKNAGQIALGLQQIADFEHRYHTLIEQGYQANPPPVAGSRLQATGQAQTKPSQKPARPFAQASTGRADVYVRFHVPLTTRAVASTYAWSS